MVLNDNPTCRMLRVTVISNCSLIFMNQPRYFCLLSCVVMYGRDLSGLVRHDSSSYELFFSFLPWFFFYCVSLFRKVSMITIIHYTVWGCLWVVVLHLRCDHYLFDLLRIYRKSVKHAFNCQTRFKFRSRQHPKGHGKVNNLSFQCIERVWQEHFEKRIYFFVISEGIRTLKRKSDFLE